MSIHRNILMLINMKIESKKIIELIKKKKIVTSSEVAEEFEVSWNTADKYLLELLVDGKVNRFKKTGVTLWMMK